MKNIVLTATAIATMLTLASTEAMAIRFMNPQIDSHQGLTILAPQPGKIKVGGPQADLQEIKLLEVQNAPVPSPAPGADAVSPAPAADAASLGVVNSIKIFTKKVASALFPN